MRKNSFYKNKGNLASGSWDSTVIIWASQGSGAFTLLATLTEHTDFITALFSMANGNLASASLDSYIYVYNTTTNLVSYKYLFLVILYNILTF
jgi:WD40 repeat protein